MKRFRDFEDYLFSALMRLRPELKDDDLPDAFDMWLSDFGPDEWISFADEYADIVAEQRMEDKRVESEREHKFPKGSESIFND